PRLRGGDRPHPAATPELGSPQAARMARRPPLGARAARSEYGGRSLAPPGTRAAAPPPPSLEASGRARTRYRGAERRVDRGLKGPLTQRRWRVLLSTDGRRPAQQLSARLCLHGVGAHRGKLTQRRSALTGTLLVHGLTT